MWQPFDRNLASEALMKIWVKGYLGIEPALDGKPFVEFGADGVTLRDLLVQLGYRGDGSLTAPGAVGRYAVLVNGRHTSHLPDGLDTVPRDGDRVAIFPPVAGG
jgi:molybdopterin converting factor small subunit